MPGPQLRRCIALIFNLQGEGFIPPTCASLVQPPHMVYSVEDGVLDDPASFPPTKRRSAAACGQAALQSPVPVVPRAGCPAPRRRLMWPSVFLTSHRPQHQLQPVLPPAEIRGGVAALQHAGQGGVSQSGSGAAGRAIWPARAPKRSASASAPGHRAACRAVSARPRDTVRRGHHTHPGVPISSGSTAQT